MPELAWSDERIRMLKLLHTQGFSYAQIANKISASTEGKRVSRNACLGKATRLGLPIRTTARPAMSAVTNRQRSEMGGLGSKVTFAIKAIEDGTRAPDVDLPPTTMVDGFRHVSFHDLKRNECRFPDGLGPFTFCGQPREGAAPYCKHHVAIAYTPASQRKVVEFKRVGGSRPSFRYDGAAA